MTAGPRGSVLATARSLLFVPGNSPDRYPKAEAANADVVVIDLEDAVQADDKVAARAAAVEWARAHKRSVVRINGVGTPWVRADLRALRGSGVPVMLPKAGSAEDAQWVRHELGGSSG